MKSRRAAAETTFGTESFARDAPANGKVAVPSVLSPQSLWKPKRRTSFWAMGGSGKK